ncbi:nucleoside/nucleotide kinase family protein [Paractinoplanes abujensis]|uniref:Pantothenate kinase n=1 Tax=Paractinoplanes abujensis TaxID=882441 RepID=A0A7W7CJW1_9ACTN|nr:nucleoside/nucleotide kinase family protein [Actinoplanes abujensis]MBB4689926.1 pantothenate kinase [Actinoplanes abujensis]GID24668.1 nucleoside/nucleotide kinase family protein [Actinoplanes abujensis]
MTTGRPLFSELVAAARRMTAGPRQLLGLTGAPGAGKSTLAARIVDALTPAAVLVPMDGFHLANAQLQRLHRADRKGALDTFDVDGYLALLGRLRDNGPATVYAPRFDRNLDEPVAAAIRVDHEVPLVVTEGNYLLARDGGWERVRPMLDQVWYVEVDDQTRVERLIRRHVSYGKPPDAARAWVSRSDEANARLVASTRDRADLIVTATAELTA